MFRNQAKPDCCAIGRIAILIRYTQNTPLVRTTWVSTPICSPSFRLSVSVSAQQSAFSIGVLSHLNAFHRSTGNSLCPYRTPAW